MTDPGEGPKWSVSTTLSVVFFFLLLIYFLGTVFPGLRGFNNFINVTLYSIISVLRASIPAVSYI